MIEQSSTVPVGRTVRVRVPATSANLGPGFDCLGLALDLVDQVQVTVTGDDVPVLDDVPIDSRETRVHVEGEGAGLVPDDETHLVVRALHVALDALGAGRPRLELTCVNRIPHGRGLGSSAAAVVAGLLAGRALVTDGEQRLDDDAVLALASEMEGHPDNAAACLFGGLTLAWSQSDGVRALRIEPREDLSLTVLVPTVELSTRTARSLLPDQVPHADAAHAAGRAALLLAALTDVRRSDLLLAATEDRLHQDYRAPAMPATAALVERLRGEGRAAVISGAGPSVLVLDAGDGAPIQVSGQWRVLALPVARDGGTVEVLSEGAVPG